MSNNLITMSTTAPEKYKVRSGTIDSGKEYEINNIAFLALKCCFEELEEFWIASNVDGFGDLDDIIMFKKRKQSDRGVAYLMQLKHQDAAKPLVSNMFLKDTGDFSFKKYSKCYSNMQTETKNSMLTYLKQNSEMVFVMFTNKSVSDKPEPINKPATDKSSIDGLLQTSLPQTSLLQTNLLQISVLQTSSLQASLLQTSLLGTSVLQTSLLQKLLLQTNLQQTRLLQTLLLHKSVTDKPSTAKPATAAGTKVVKFLIKVNETSSILDDIGRDGYAFKIDYKVLAVEQKINEAFLKKFHIFTKQSPNNSMEEKIKNILIQNLENKLQLSHGDVSDIVLKFVKFIEQWAKGAFGGYYRLPKDNILKKLVELLLIRYMFTLPTEDNGESKEEDDIEENEEDDIEENEEEYFWYHTTKDKDVTVIDDPDNIVKQYVNNATNKIICNRGIVNSITKINRLLMRVVRIPTEFSKSVKYELLWKANKIPLALKVSDERGVRHIREVLKQFPKVFAVIILNKTKTHFEGFADLKLFANVTDLHTKHQEYILNQPIKFQGREGSSIKKLKINKEDFLKSFKVNDVVHILSGQFNVGGAFEDTPQFFVEMSLTTYSFDIEILKSAEDIFVVRCGISLLDNFESVLQNQLGVYGKKIIRWDRLNKADFNAEIIIFNDIENLQEIEVFCLTLAKPIHFLAWRNGDRPDLIKSISIKENFKKQKKTVKKSILAKELLQNFHKNKQTLIISAIPGMGKSVLMNYFALNMPTHLWVLDIPLAKYQDHYRNWDGQNSESQQLNFERFVNEVKAQPTLNTEIFDSVFEQCLNSKNVVFLLDGLDEVPVNLQNGAMHLIKFINQLGYYTCVTTRPLLQEQLELTLYTSAITLNMFTKDEQKSFLTNYFANVGSLMPSNKKVKEFVTKLLKATKSNLNDFDHQFTGVPLQTMLLAEVFANDFLKYIDKGIFKNQRFDLIYLYENFIDKKIKIACAKNENVPEAMIDCFKECRSLYGLRHLFDKQDLQELKIEEELLVINKRLPHTLQLIQKDGITVIDGDSNVTFVHQTYAEYLAANWLAENFNTSHKEIVRKLIRKTFRPHLIVVRNMFDRIFAKNSQLHTAIVNRQVSKVKTLILEENAFDITDSGERTILHLISAWGLHHPDRYKCVVLEKDDILSVLNSIPENKLKHVEDELLHYTPLEYAILSRSLGIADSLVSVIQNPSCIIVIAKEETDCILRHVKESYSVSLYLVILKCFIRTESNKHETNDIHKKIRNENLDRVQFLISEQNVDVLDSNGSTLLHSATKGGHTDTVQFLLAKKANVNQRDNNGRSALHWASYLGYLDIIYILLNNEAEPNATDCYNLTAYHYTILSSLENQADIVSLLISRNRTVTTENAIDKIQYLINRYKVHPIYLTDWVSQSAVLNLMLSHNVDVNLKGWKDMTALMLAAQNNDIDGIKLLLANGADVHAQDYRNQTALYYATIEGHEIVVTMLLTKNADVNAIDSYKKSPLHFAAILDHQDVLTILLTNNADVNARDSDNRTPLHFAAIKNHQEVVNILLTNGADYNAKDSHNKTPLYWAAVGGNQEVVTILLSYNADVNASDSDNKTPLHWAALLGHQDIVTILLTKNPDVNARDSDNKTPLDYAIATGHHTVVNILTNAQI